MAPREGAELLEALLVELGALAISTEDAGGENWLETRPGEPPPWKHVRLSALFASDIDVDGLERTVAAFPGAPRRGAWAAEFVADRDWVREGIRHVRPLRFGNRLWVCPTAAALPAVASDAVLLRLDPGLGFGTGTHETTALCLEWLESQSSPTPQVIDYGCGSGILGIAALLLGSGRVRACDVDPHALDATRENAQRNGVDARLWVGLPERMSGDSADGILANILASTLCDLAGAIARLQRPGGWLVLSGILAHEAGDVEAVFSPWYVTSVWRRRGDWVLVHGRRMQESTTPLPSAIPPHSPQSFA